MLRRNASQERSGRFFGGSVVAFLLLATGVVGEVGAAAAERAPDRNGDRERDQVRAIEGLVRAADFDGAERQARSLLTSGRLDRRDVAHVYLQLGIVAAARRDDVGAAASFRRALVLEPDMGLPVYAGPHVTLAFGRATTSVRSRPSLAISVRLRSAGQGGSGLSVNVQIDGESEGLARRLQLRGGGWLDDVRELRGDHLSFAEAIPQSLRGCASVIASILDEYGNEVWPSAGRTEICAATTAPLRNAAGLPAPPPIKVWEGAGSVSPVRPIPAHVWVGAALAGGAAIGTGVLGGVALWRRREYEHSVHDPAVTFDERRALHDRAASAERLATYAAAATGALGLSALVLYLTRPGSVVGGGFGGGISGDMAFIYTDF